MRVPIYEFYCAACHTVFSFFSARVAPEARPACPKCGAPELPRRPSRFATLSSGRPEGEDEGADDLLAGVDEGRLEQAFAAMAGEFEALTGGPEGAEPDPRQLSRALRRFTELTGLEAGPRLREVFSRLERGDDPETLESELGDGAEGDEDLAEFFRLRSTVLGTRSRRPRVDETLHFL
ncbi:MAG: zinc ribbon domain-containing protein [Thermoanaerobaculia bacterium]|nr:MAG: zinc ribbon domain-containing protein [Thermoanaerobaculia bacterium]